MQIEYVLKQVADGASFYASTDYQSITVTTEHDFLLIRNPAGSGKRLILTHFVGGVNSSSVVSKLTIYKKPTITSTGTVITPESTSVNDTDIVPKALIYRDPTISAKTKVIGRILKGGSADSRGINRYYWVDPGHDILLTIENDTANASSFADIYWLEV